MENNTLSINDKKQLKTLLALIKNDIPNYEDYIYQFLNIGEYEVYILDNIKNKELLINYIEKYI